jgi:chemotaxis protein methyltransferase CheR
MDFVFCRNVIIYFDKESKKRLVNRFADIIKPGGYLFIGHSESLYNVTDRFELIGKTIYRRVG